MTYFCDILLQIGISIHQMVSSWRRSSRIEICGRYKQTNKGLLIVFTLMSVFSLLAVEVQGLRWNVQGNKFCRFSYKKNITIIRYRYYYTQLQFVTILYTMDTRNTDKCMSCNYLHWGCICNFTLTYVTNKIQVRRGERASRSSARLKYVLHMTLNGKWRVTWVDQLPTEIL
jgi:hypothetical protein